VKAKLEETHQNYSKLKLIENKLNYGEVWSPLFLPFYNHKMDKIMTEKGREEYSKYMNEQFKILEGHFTRIMLRCYNKFSEIAARDELTK